MVAIFKLLIADDESMVREGISQLCDWSAREIVLCPAAQNGKEARNLILAHKPDLIIIDIRMPFLSGIEVIEQTASAIPSSEFLILSGYGEFEYAKRAMAYGVKHFILKPCNNDKLLAAVDEALEHLRNRQVIRDYVSGRVVDRQARSRCADILAIDSTATTPRSAIVQQALAYVEEHFSDESLNLSYLAREVLFTNADYLGKVFKKEIIQSFSAYLQARRIREAQSLLLVNPAMKIFEIAQRCGYGGNTQYFSIQFRKLTRMTPTEYAREFRL